MLTSSFLQNSEYRLGKVVNLINEQILNTWFATLTQGPLCDGFFQDDGDTARRVYLFLYMNRFHFPQHSYNSLFPACFTNILAGFPVV